MKLAVMQPYLFPYIGYFQLIRAVDLFVIYDDVKYTKKGWINRNRILSHGHEVPLSLPLEKGSDSLLIKDRRISGAFRRADFLNDIREAYRHAPFFAPTLAMLAEALPAAETNLFSFLEQTLRVTSRHLGISTPIHVSSAFPVESSLRGKDKVMALCEMAAAATYVNAIGGQELYDRAEFKTRGIDLYFLKSQSIPYPQSLPVFLPWLSIIDVLMFLGAERTSAEMLDAYELI